MDRNLMMRAHLLDCCEQWTSLGELRERVEAKMRADGEPDLVLATEDVLAIVDALRSEGLLVADDADPQAPPLLLRDRRGMVLARADALGTATCAGVTTAKLLETGATPRDLDALVEHDLLARKDDSFSLALKADDPLWREGARAFLLRTIPPAKRGPELDDIQREVWAAIAMEGDWIATGTLHERINVMRETRDGAKAEHMAAGPLEEALTHLFHVELVEMHDQDGVRSWRETKDRVVDRHTRVFHALSFAIDGRTTEELAAQLGVPLGVVETDISVMSDVGLVELVNGRAALRRGPDGMETAMDRVIAAEVAHVKDPAPEQDPRVQEQIREIASWREKHASEKRRADDLASWIGRRTGCRENDALDEVRGVTVVAKSNREEFEWTSSRIVDAAEKGAILGEIIALDNKIAAERTHLEEVAGEHKSRIKGYTAQIQDLKNAAACNQRVVSCTAYKRTDWERKKVVIHAVDDHRVLAEEDLPQGTQRTIESLPVSVPENGEHADAIVARLAAITDEQLADFAARAKERGWKVAVDLTKTGAERVTELAAPVATAETEPAPALSPLPKDEAELTEAVFATTEGAGVLAYCDVVHALEERFEVPAGGGPKIRTALDRLVERGALAEANGAWVRPAAAAAPDAGPAEPESTAEPGPLASEEQRAEHQEKKAKRSRKAKTTEASAT